VGERWLTVAVATVAAVVAWLPAAAIELPPAPRRHSDLVEAQTLLRHAREYTEASAKLAAKDDCHAVDGFHAACQTAWNAVWTCPGSAEVLAEAGERYNEALAGLLEAGQRSGRLTPEGLWVGQRWRPICVPVVGKALPIADCEIESIRVACPPADSRITRRHLRAGFGVPVVVRVRHVAGDAFVPQRRSLAATAVLRFALPGDENFLEKFSGPLARDYAPAILDLANPVEIAAVHIGPVKPHLAADLTMPLLDMLDGMPKASVAGFLQPFSSSDAAPRLEFLEPHRPGRIPVVFIHGLASDEGTWFDLLNELRTWPTFHRRFEPWLFRYPTGAGFALSSASLRRQLRQAVVSLDPGCSDAALDNLVLVGHSMGGLHAKMQAVQSGDAIWNSIACRPVTEIRGRPEVRRLVADTYFFEPLPFVKRVVYIATPHRGSALASLGIGRLASLSVRPPPVPTAIHEEVVTLNPGAFRPDFERRVPTSIDILEPSSEILAALESLRPPCWVTTHSIIGKAHSSLLSGGDDCVVGVESARISGATSELVVPASHTKVHHHPQTVAEIRRILTQHLHEMSARE
jgi:pimeloyl-ACP methyl ester carboxylesterase